MPTTTTKLDTNVRTFSNAIGMTIQPYSDNDTLGDTIYDVTEIVADTVSIEPDDNEVNTVDAEFRDTPLFENVTLGQVQFAATCVDFQNAMMKAIFGWSESGTGVFAPTSYTDLYAAIVVKFTNADIVLPKVKMNSKAVIGTLKTGYGEGQLAGTAYAGYVKVGDANAVQTTWGIVPSGTSYTIVTSA